MNQALKTVLPVKTKVKNVEKKTVELIISKEQALTVEEKYKKRNARAKLRLLKELIEEGSISRDVVVNKLNITSSTLKAMEEEGVIAVSSETAYRNPISYVEQPEYDIILNDNQRAVADSIRSSMDNAWAKNKAHRVHLIHGITGSGKTEVYIDLIAHCINAGKEAIVLIPEIALTYQTVKRFTRRFGDKVSIIN